MCACDFCDDPEGGYATYCEFCEAKCPQGDGWELRIGLGLMRWQLHRCKNAVEDLGGDPIELVGEAQAHRLHYAVAILYEASLLDQRFRELFPYP